MIPYPSKELIWTHAKNLTDEQIKALFDSAEYHKRTEWLFYDDGILTADEWLSFVKNTKIPLHCWLVQLELTDRGAVGFFWLNGFQGKAAQVHFCTWDMTHDEAVLCAKLSLKWLKENKIVASLYGLTPITFTHVIRYLQEAGFRILGRLPKACYIAEENKYRDGIISIYDFKEQGYGWEKHADNTNSASSGKNAIHT